MCPCVRYCPSVLRLLFIHVPEGEICGSGVLQVGLGGGDGGCWVSDPSWLGSEARQAGRSQQSLDHAPIPLGGRGRVDGGVQTLPVASALWEGWLSSQSTHFQRDVVFMSLPGTTFSEHDRPVARQPRPPPRKGFCSGCSTAKRRSWSLTGSCGWVVGSLPTARVALFVFALGPRLHSVPLLTPGSERPQGAGGQLEASPSFPTFQALGVKGS